MKIKVCILILITSIIFFANSTLAQEKKSVLDEARGQTKVEGIVISIRGGELERSKNKSWTRLKVKQQVYLGERIRSGKTTVAIVEFPDIGRFVIGPSSEIKLGKDPKNLRTDIDRGFLWLESDLPKDGKAFITTTLATAGIRGTAFSVCYDGKNYCACTCSGKVEVTLNNGQTITVPKGKYIGFTSDLPSHVETQPAITLLEKTGTAFDFCFTCHVVGGEGKLK